MNDEEDYLAVSGIQHFCFCRRQWALIHIEQQWIDNAKTTEGILFHENAHNNKKSEKRGGIITLRGLRIKSDNLKLTGICDVVEFIRDDNGISLGNYTGLWKPYPIEYKRGCEKNCDADLLQLCAQAMCLEEMLSCEITSGAIYYGKTKRRFPVEFTRELRECVRGMVKEMGAYWHKGFTPKAVVSKKCEECSLLHVCVPQIVTSQSVSEYINKRLLTDETIT